MTKVTKTPFSFEASLPHGAFALQIRQNLGLQTVTLLRSPIPPASVNICYTPANAQGQHVLPDFGRSELQGKLVQKI